MELYADVASCAVVEPAAPDPTLFGVAMVAATATGLYPDLPAACAAMAQPDIRLVPNPEAKSRLDRDYRIQLAMQRHRAELQAMGSPV